MRICLIASGYPCKSKPVLDIFISEQAKAMVKHGLIVHVITAGDNSSPNEESEDGVHVHRVMNFQFWPARLYPLVFSYEVLVKSILLSRKANFDVIHCDFADHAGLAGVVTSKMLRRPLVLRVHGYDVYRNRKINYGLALSRWMRYMVRFVLKRADRLLVSSKALKKILKEWDVDSSKIILIPMGINLYKNQTRNPDKESQGILTVANLFPIKNVGYALEAMPYVLEKVPSAKYTIVGDGPERGRLEKIAKEKGLSSRVNFVGEVKYEELFQYYSTADVFVLPSIHESFGVVKLEAFAFGMPVIATDGGAAGEGIIEGETGFVVPLNQPKKLADAIITILSNPDLRKSMGRKGRKIVLRQYLWEHNVEKLFELYNSLLKK